MTDPKAKGIGLFISKKDKATSTSAPNTAARPKDVKTRWLYVGAGAIAVMVIASTVLGNKPAPQPLVQPKQPTALVNVTPKGIDKQSFEAGVGQDLAALKEQVAKMVAESNRKDEEIKALRNGKNSTATTPTNLPPGIVPPPQMDNTGGLGTTPTTAIPPSPPTPIVIPPTFPRGTTSGKNPSAAPELQLPPSATSASGNSGAPIVFDAPSTNASVTTSNKDVASTATAKGTVTTKKNTGFGMLPAGSFAPVSLLNGLDAGTSTATQSNPMPVLMNINDHATLPGSAKYRIKNCFVLGTGYGDLSAERVYIRYSRMSCVDRNDKLVLSQDVAGYVVDSDGKLGLRGKVVDRQGAKLGAAMLAGFAQGLSNALGGSQGTSTTSSTGITNTLTGSSALRASGLAGAQSATSQLAEFYLKEAQAIFPVISVDTGRTATIVFTNSVNLNWTHGDAPYVQEMKPNQ